MSDRVLFVDDEPNVLAGLERQLRKRYAVRTAAGGEAGLAVIAAEGPFAVVVSDMRMPGMNGAQFLTSVRERHPDSVRLLLTGYAEVDAAIAAVNQGGLFRFLTKPCDPATLTAALDDALAQHRLVTAERDLLDRTLRGSVQVLGEVLALVNPAAFGRALRVQALARQLARAANADLGWDVEVAAILYQLGYAGVSERVLTLADRGGHLSAADQAELDAAPKHAADLISRIPRLDRVIEIVRHLGPEADGKPPPLGSRLLRLAHDFDTLAGRGLPPAHAVDHLKSRGGRYDPTLLAGLDHLVRESTQPEGRTLAVSELTAGMVLDEDLYGGDGTFLLRHGNTITPPLLVRLGLLAHAGQIPPTLRVLLPPPGGKSHPP
jgi:response regulator RpfG family c-di-GMP phosphodiesterase